MRKTPKSIVARRVLSQSAREAKQAIDRKPIFSIGIEQTATGYHVVRVQTDELGNSQVERGEERTFQGALVFLKVQIEKLFSSQSSIAYGGGLDYR